MKTKILLVGIDGLLLKIALESGRAPALNSLKEQGYFSELTVDAPTYSGPGWSTLLTGSTHAEHQVTDNRFIGHALLHRPDLLSLAFYQDQSTRTFAAAGWPPIVDPSGLGPIIHERREQQLAYKHRVIVRDGETYGYEKIDAEIADASCYAIEKFAPDVSFIYFCGADEAAHAYGILGAQYLNAIARIDDYVERLHAAIKTQIASTGDPWLLVITTDHGHVNEGGHGGDSPQEKASFVIAVGLGRDNPHWPASIGPEELTPLLLSERI
ncbi:MAG: alkaline phosphatase family protein [Actinomycetes bacterium]